MYTVDGMVKPGFGHSWHEAVALVQEVAAELGPAATVPAAADLYLHVTGSLTLGTTTETGEHPVTGLARLLAASLQGIDGPAQLRQLADENAGPTPKYLTVQDFSRALAFFERPGRTDTLREVALRLAAVPRTPTGPEAEIQKLRERLTVGETKRIRKRSRVRSRARRARENS